MLAQQLAIEKIQKLAAQQDLLNSISQTQAQLRLQQAAKPVEIINAINQQVLKNTQSQKSKYESRVYVGSLHYDIKESDVRALFESFGPIKFSEMQIDPLTGKSKGFCFLEFETIEASQAAQAMDGFELAGRKVSEV